MEREGGRGKVSRMEVNGNTGGGSNSQVKRMINSNSQMKQVIRTTATHKQNESSVTKTVTTLSENTGRRTNLAVVIILSTISSVRGLLFSMRIEL